VLGTANPPPLARKLPAGWVRLNARVRLQLASDSSGVEHACSRLIRPSRKYGRRRRSRVVWLYTGVGDPAALAKPLDQGAPVVYSYWTVRASQDPRPVVGLIGLGNMGTAFAERLLDAGYPLVVSNRTPEKAEALAARSAAVPASPAQLAEQADVILTSLADDEAFESVATAAIAAARPGSVLVDLSTVSPAASTRVAVRAESASVGYVRAPVSGNPTVVRAGNLSVIVSGAEEDIDRVEPVIRAIGPTVHRVGDGEQARIVKLAINLMVAGIAQLMSEALVLGEAADVPRTALLDVMGSSAVGAPFVKYKTEPLVRDDYSATFTTALMEKDIDLALDAAGEAGVHLPLTSEMKSHLRAAIAAGYAEDDFIVLFQHLRNTSGLLTRSERRDQEVMR
jgi:3-hydroxyisobutyrate dehydrogenase-like beta-hydroxyacid dehydrogenase